LLQRYGAKKYAFLVLGSSGEVIKSNLALYNVVQIQEEELNRGEGDEDEIRKNLTPEEEEGEDDLFGDD